jgi:hypothetical protein
MVSRVLGGYRLESLEKVSVGLGLQALRYISITATSCGSLVDLMLTFILQCPRMHMVDNTTHLFLLRTYKEAQDVLWLFSVPKSFHGMTLQRYGLFSFIYHHE